MTNIQKIIEIFKSFPNNKILMKHLNLCSTKIFNNRPIDVQIQQDCKEFYDSVCDSLESCLKNTKYNDSPLPLRVSRKIIFCYRISEDFRLTMRKGLEPRRRRPPQRNSLTLVSE